MKNFLLFCRDFRKASPSLKRLILLTILKAAIYDACYLPAVCADKFDSWHARMDYNIDARHREIRRRFGEEQSEG